jgi:hypothetical protein
MSVGSTYALARRLRKRLDPKLIEFVNDPDQMLLSDRVGAISGIGGYVRAADGEPTAAFHERLKGGTGERRGLRAHRTFRGDPARGSAAEARSGGSMTARSANLADRGNCSARRYGFRRRRCALGEVSCGGRFRSGRASRAAR